MDGTDAARLRTRPRGLVVALLALALALPVAGQIIVGEDTDARPEPAQLEQSHGGVRADVDRPKPEFGLQERAARLRALPAFQPLVDAAPAGSVLRPPAGAYRGPVLLDKPLTIEGGGQVTIDAGDRGTVFVMRTDNATLRGLHLTGSGASYDTDDSCLDVRGDGNVVEDTLIDDCLFGIDLKQSNHATLRRNHIRSKPLDVQMRGDAIRLWYSSDNTIVDNRIADSRDMVAWYSNRNLYRGNTSTGSRYSVHFMFSNDNVVEHNRFDGNTVGVYLMYAERTIVRHNLIAHATSAAGMGIGFKESSAASIEDNSILYCAVGISSDLSPFQPGSTIRFDRNRIAYNGIGVHFTSELGGNVFAGNTFEGNLVDAVQSGRGRDVHNEWQGNYYDTYAGFDRDHDGYGDSPHLQYAYADRLWIETPVARFFMLTPVMELLDFLERLAPVSTPELQLRDDHPRFRRPEPST